MLERLIRFGQIRLVSTHRLLLLASSLAEPYLVCVIPPLVFTLDSHTLHSPCENRQENPIYHMLKDQGVPHEDCVLNPDHTVWSSLFPYNLRKKCKVAEEVTALEHLGNYGECGETTGATQSIYYC